MCITIKATLKADDETRSIPKIFKILRKYTSEAKREVIVEHGKLEELKMNNKV